MKIFYKSLDFLNISGISLLLIIIFSLSANPIQAQAYYSVSDYWYNPFEYNPYDYQQSYNPYGYQSSYYPDYQQSYNPYGYQQSYNPYGYQQSYNPYGWNQQYGYGGYPNFGFNGYSGYEPSFYNYGYESPYFVGGPFSSILSSWPTPYALSYYSYSGNSGVPFPLIGQYPFTFGADLERNFPGFITNVPDPYSPNYWYSKPPGWY